ncbi:MAG: cytochrome c [Reichenbachiella sp.]|uniref:c-type cytochrome n=1 Tax=Reichenbachiella sp. TaxID=2184521 RepID=UPI0032649AF4
MSLRTSLKSTSYLIYLGIMSCAWDQVDPEFDCSLTPIEIELLESNTSECSNPSGGFTLGVTGGESPYTFSSDAGTSTNGEFQNVAAGSYLVTVSDANGCTSQSTVEIQNEEGVNFDAVTVIDTECGSAEGRIEVEVSGGIEPYSYALNGLQSQTSATFTGLTNGTHEIRVSDTEGCVVTQKVQIISGVSFENTIEKIIKNNCTSCHGVSASPSFNNYEEIKNHAESIKRVTTNGSMPKGSSISQEEIDNIACWVNDGALSN